MADPERRDPGAVQEDVGRTADQTAGFRLVYDVRDGEVLVLVVAVGKRERHAVYPQADQR